MKNLLLIVIAVLGFSAVSFGQSSVTASATATLVTPLSIAVTEQMNFGTVAATANEDGTVVLDNTNAVTVTGGAKVIDNGAVKSALFTVTGAAGEAISVSTTSAQIELTSAGGKKLKVNTWTPDATGNQNLDGDGKLVIKVGATLEIPKDAEAGTYVNNSAYTVTVDYN